MIIDSIQLFPARAGMNRQMNTFEAMAETVPRTRGDEPRQSGFDSKRIACSPHARG